MRKRAPFWWVFGISAASALGLVAWADEQEEKVTLDQVPAAVKATILKEAAGAPIKEIERETKNGNTVYEAEFVLDGKEIEIAIDAAGTLLSREAEDAKDNDDDLTLDQLPEPAKAALVKLAGGAALTEVGRETEHGTVVFEAEWTVGGVEHEAAVLADGTLVETEQVIRLDQAPAAVQAAVAKHFGAGAKVVVVQKMIVAYEVEGKVNGKGMELLVFPTGQVHESADGDDDDTDDDHDADGPDDDD